MLRFTHALALTVLSLAARPVLSAEAAAEAEEPSSVALRFGAALGGAYTTNAFSNASDEADLLGLARLSADVDWSAADWMILKLAYRGELELFRRLKAERQIGNLGDLTLGLRPSDSLYLSLRGGAENATYPTSSLYAFTGGFGHVGLRIELGDSSTVRGSYRIRHDFFPNYDLDNTSHTGLVAFEIALGDSVELELPVELGATSFGERFLLDDQGKATATPCRSRAWRVEPTLRISPSFRLRVLGSVRGDWNDSSDSYYYGGPFGTTSTAVSPELIRSFYAFYGASSRWEFRWQPADALIATLRVAGGARWFTDRPAFDAQGLATSAKERDLWLQPGAELEWRFSSFMSLSAAYSFARQWSNDALWDYDGHRIEVMLGGWYGD